MNSDAARPQYSIAVIGLGTTGSATTTLLAHMSEIGKLVLVDHERYESKNLSGQNITSADIGLHKVAAMAGACVAICPDLEVVTYPCKVEEVPLACLRVDLIISCVDSPEARQSINAIARQLNIPWLDTAVNTVGSLVRVASYQAFPESPCMECRWSDDHYKRRGARYPCDQPDGVTATAAPAELGALAAAHAVMAARKMLNGDSSSAGHELFVNGNLHTMHTARFTVNPDCRLDHRNLEIHEVDDFSDQATLGTLIDRFQATHMAVPALRFVLDSACDSCKYMAETKPQLNRALQLPRCSNCGQQQKPVGYSMLHRLPLENRWRALTLRQLGIQQGDVLSLRIADRAASENQIHITFGSNL